MIRLGIDELIRLNFAPLRGLRVGLLAHGASLTSTLEPSTEVFRKQHQFKLIKFFGPEHGLAGSAQDMVAVDSTTGHIPVISLYGKTFASLSPSAEAFSDIDILVCDLQDIGTRYYTFIYTLALCLKGAAQTKTKIMVLDRPNPLNGITLEGRPQQAGFESFVGLYPLPVRHGMTMGELARYFNATQDFNAELEIIPMQGWQREMYYDETGLPWINPSPNMPSLTTALLYPGTCLIEATELSEGRGTTRPFEYVGVPGLDGIKLSQNLNRLALPGVQFHPINFIPTHQKQRDKNCAGVQIHITDRHQLQPYALGLQLLRALREEHAGFSWRQAPYEFEISKPAIDLLTGSNEFRLFLERKKNDPIEQLTQAGVAEFAETRREFLLY